jgi:hypothetical protein
LRIILNRQLSKNNKMSKSVLVSIIKEDNEDSSRLFLEFALRSEM